MDKVGINYAIDLTDWQTIFKSLKVRASNIIVECEGADINPFNIGPIEKAGRKKVKILHFDAEGYFESEPTAIDYNDITQVRFDTQYINVFSKYTRYKKIKTINK